MESVAHWTRCGCWCGTWLWNWARWLGHWAWNLDAFLVRNSSIFGDTLHRFNHLWDVDGLGSCDFDILHHSAHERDSDHLLDAASGWDLLGNRIHGWLVNPSHLSFLVWYSLGDLFHPERVSLFLDRDHLLAWYLHLVWNGLVLGNHFHVIDHLLNRHSDLGWNLNHLKHLAGGWNSKVFLDFLSTGNLHSDGLDVRFIDSLSNLFRGWDLSRHLLALDNWHSLFHHNSFLERHLGLVRLHSVHGHGVVAFLWRCRRANRLLDHWCSTTAHINGTGTHVTATHVRGTHVTAAHICWHVAPGTVRLRDVTLAFATSTTRAGTARHVRLGARVFTWI